MKRIALLFWCAWTLMAQQEPCGFFEIDNQPGFNLSDLQYVADRWPLVSLETDFNNDGFLDIRDLISMESCVDHLGHGLIGTYYGFNLGDGQGITYPDFGNLPDPVVVRATETLNQLPDTWDPLMDSEMQENSVGLFEGFLFVEESGSYDFQIIGRRGIKLFIDGQYVTGFEDGWNSTVEGTVQLAFGLVPIRVEYYTDNSRGSIVLQWRQPGHLDYQVITQNNLYHSSFPVSPYASTELECLFEPASGTRTSQGIISLHAFFMGPDTDLHAYLGGQEIVLQDGMWLSDVALTPGLNHLQFHLTDGVSREKDFDYFIYCDQENATTSGLVARLYNEMFDTAPLPDIKNLDPFSQVVVPGCQLDNPYIGGIYTSAGVLCHLDGVLAITQPGWYEFHISNTGSLQIDGVSVCNLDGEYRGQWQPSGSIYLEGGNHHFHLQTGSTWNFPEMAVTWAYEGGTAVPIPNGQFHHTSSNFLPNPETDPPDGNGRITNGLLAEYLFTKTDRLRDSSGRHHALDEDLRVRQLSPQGIDLAIGGGLFSEQGGVHAGQIIRENHAATFEAEVVWKGETPTDWYTMPILSLMSSSGSVIAGLFVRHDTLYFGLRDQEDYHLDSDVSFNDFVILHKNERIHVAATWDQGNLALFFNGQQVDSGTNMARPEEWSNNLNLSVGNPTTFWDWSDPEPNDRHFAGQVLMAALYDRALSPAEINTNYLANQTLIPNPVAPGPTVAAFPPAGTSQAQLDEAHHILNRLSFGPSQISLEDILNVGVDSWITSQLNPQGIDDSELENYLSQRNLKQETRWMGLLEEVLNRQTLSKRQLNEVMTQFWENHFSTQIDKTNYPREEWLENMGFRTHALGSFKDLLLVSAMSYPMNVYLDNIYNRVGAPNENYAREIMELHTFGANNGYTQEDIVQAARCFTGWSIRRGKFHFDPGEHDYGEKTFPSLGLTVPAGGGIADGLMLIDALVQSPNCADFIAWKLCQLLIDDDPPADVLAAAATTFVNSNGDIAQVIQTITSHSRFRTDLNYRGNKTKTPLEFLVSALRVTDSIPEIHGVYYFLDQMGMELFNDPFPTGYEEAGNYWVNTNSLLFRWNFIHLLTSNRGNGNAPGADIFRMVESRGLTTSQEVMDLFEGLTTHGTQESSVNSILLDYLTNGDPGNFSMSAETIDQEVRQTLSLFLRLPEFNRQ